MKKQLSSKVTTVVEDYQMKFKLLKPMKNDLRDRAILETLYSTGIRTYELCNMQISHVDLDEKQIVSPEREGIKAKIVRFLNLCKLYLIRYLSIRQDSSPYLFVTRKGGPIHRRSINQISTYYKCANSPGNLGHCALRHSFYKSMVKHRYPS